MATCLCGLRPLCPLLRLFAFSPSFEVMLNEAVLRNTPLWTSTPYLAERQSNQTREDNARASALQCSVQRNKSDWSMPRGNWATPIIDQFAFILVYSCVYSRRMQEYRRSYAGKTPRAGAEPCFFFLTRDPRVLLFCFFLFFQQILT